MKGEGVEKIWESSKKGIKECDTEREVKIKKGSVEIAGTLGRWEIVKEKEKWHTRRIEDGRKEDKGRKSIGA